MMDYSDLKDILAQFEPDLKPEFNQNCHRQYTIYLDEKLKPEYKCQCICDKALIKDKYIDISNYQMELPWKEFLKIVNSMDMERDHV